MRYQHRQVIELTGISKDAMRYWKQHLRPLQTKDGRSQGYTFAEVVAIGAIADAVKGFSIGVEHLAPLADKIFALVAEATEPGREPGVLCLGSNEVVCLPEPPRHVSACTLLLPLAPIIARIRERIAGNDTPAPQVQFELPLPGRRVVGLNRRH